MKWLICLIVLCIVGGITSLSAWELLPEQCDPGRGKGRVEWILLQRHADYGWGHHTHRANIALAVHEYNGNAEETEKMGAQLEFEVARALFRNASSPIDANDLALYIHALMATNRNPRNFHGNDLVEDLLHRVKYRNKVNPYLVLALCNAGVVNSVLLDKIKHHAESDHEHGLIVDFRQLEYKALTLKALACGQSAGYGKFGTYMKTAIECLTRRQNESTGSFGNALTTSLAVQALTAADDVVNYFVGRGEIGLWRETEALKYLEREAYIDVDMVKAYYIEMALHARTFNFIKDIHPTLDTKPPPQLPVDNRISVKYTIQNALKPDHYFTATLKVHPNYSFLDVMLLAANLNSYFKFSWNNETTSPIIYTIGDTPNDAEENLFWRICRQDTEYYKSPDTLFPTKNEHIIMCYNNTGCGKMQHEKD